MAEISAIDESEELKEIHEIWGVQPPSGSRVDVNRLAPEEAALILRTKGLGLNSAPGQPLPSDSTLVGRTHLLHREVPTKPNTCLLYTSDAADE